MTQAIKLIRERTGAVALETPPRFTGGEGKIYSVAGSELLAKVYHAPSAERGAKLLAMLQNPPNRRDTCSAQFSIAWPVDRLLEPGGSGKCVGYLMPRMEGQEPLIRLYNPKARRQRVGRRLLLKTARNLAAAVRSLHESGYVIGDLNESNILVGQDASVSFVDTDSFQVRASGRVYRCLVGKPEFTPPELQGILFNDIDRKPEHDHFGLAALLFLLLMEGNHPFSAEYTGKGDRPTLQKRVALGHWPHSSKGNIPYKSRKQAPPFLRLPSRIQALMRQCFEDGHKDPGLRPTAAMWEAALEDQVGFFLKRLSERVLGRFPAVANGALWLCRWVSQTRYRWVWVSALALLLVLLLLGFFFPILSPVTGNGNTAGGRGVGGKETPRLWLEAQGK